MIWAGSSHSSDAPVRKKQPRMNQLRQKRSQQPLHNRDCGRRACAFRHSANEESSTDFRSVVASASHLVPVNERGPNRLAETLQKSGNPAGGFLTTAGFRKRV